jgi:predicted TIM-barrel fold metal-dependent hydrolase
MIDAFVSHLWNGIDDLGDYMDPGWYGGLRRGNKAQASLRVPPLYVDPRGRKAYREWNGEINKGLSYDAFEAEILAERDPERVVLGFEEGIAAAGYTNPFLSLAITRAVNDWSLDQWVSRDDRLYSLPLIPTNYPDEAAEEIRRLGKNDRVVGIMLGPNLLGVPYGMAIYDPIYQACVDMDLPIVLHAKADISATMATPQTAGGLVSTYTEYHMLAYQSVATHIISLIAQGVFDIFPSLEVMVVGAASGWIPSSMWRTDWAYGYSANEAPWLTKLPSEYFGKHVRMATYGLEKPRQEGKLAQLLRTMSFFDHTLVYASGYPSVWGSEPLDPVLARLPEEWHDGVIDQNVRSFYRWPDRPAREKPAPTLRRSTMPGPRVDEAHELAGMVRTGE